MAYGGGVKEGKIGLTKQIAVVGGGHHSGHTVFRRGAAPEKKRAVPFGKLWVNSLEVTTACSDRKMRLLMERIYWIGKVGGGGRKESIWGGVEFVVGGKG